MRATALLLACLLAGASLCAVASAAAASRVAAIDECTLLTDAQAATIMQAKPFGSGAPDNEACSWHTDPNDRQHYAYVVVDVQRRAKLLRRYGNDLRRYLDTSTNVGIDRLPGVGDKAFSTYSPLSGPGSSDGIWVLVGKRVVEIGWQASERTLHPSPQFDRIVKIVKKIVAKVRRG